MPHMGAAELDAAGEAWEMRFASAEIATGTDSLHPTSRQGWIASAIRDAFELFGYDGMVSPFLGS
jgi:hypothetical protein